MMPEENRKNLWASGDAYEPYVGRWSRLVAREFLGWLARQADLAWLDVGCGTGALTRTILDIASPREVRGVDPSEGFIRYAREHVRDRRVTFVTGDATLLPSEAGAYDVVVSGLVLNFVPQPVRAAVEMARVARSGGTVAAYVWDYAGEMQLMRYFWDAAVALDPSARSLDEGVSFASICKPEPLRELFNSAGLQDVRVRAIDVPTRFRDFDDYWGPFLGGQGPAPRYAMSLSEERRAALCERIRERLPISPDGSIDLIARAWAVAGTCSGDGQ
jgi:SAM-dependent methyltransferase